MHFLLRGFLSEDVAKSCLKFTTLSEFSKDRPVTIIELGNFTGLPDATHDGSRFREVGLQNGMTNSKRIAAS